MNGAKNIDFYAGKAEELLNGVLNQMDSKHLVAVVDPPRAGLHPKALQASLSITRDPIYQVELQLLPIDLLANTGNLTHNAERFID